MVSKLGKGTSLGTREKMWLRECRIVSGIKAWESHSTQVYWDSPTKPASPVYKEHKVGKYKNFGSRVWGDCAIRKYLLYKHKRTRV